VTGGSTGALGASGTSLPPPSKLANETPARTVLGAVDDDSGAGAGPPVVEVEVEEGVTIPIEGVPAVTDLAVKSPMEEDVTGGADVVLTMGAFYREMGG
jgi:hypothetical protein